MRFAAEQVCQILARARGAPADSGRPDSHWTPTESADDPAQRGIVEQVSPRTVSRWLAQAQLKPHRARYWLNHDRAADPDGFDADVRAVCTT